MEVRTRPDGGAYVVSLEGELDAYWAAEAREQLWKLLEQGHTRLVLDLGGLAYVSSAGLRILLQLQQRISGLHGELGLAAAQPFVLEVLEDSGFARALRLFLTVEEALAAVRPGEAAADTAWTGAQDRATAAGTFQFRAGEPGAARLRLVGEADDLLYSRAVPEKLTTLRLAEAPYALGVGALGAMTAGAEGAVMDRLGELLSIAGATYWLPGDGRQVPDFMFSPDGEGQLPLHLLSGVALEGSPRVYGRFQASDTELGADLGEVGRQVLEWATGQDGYAGLVGIALRAELTELWGVGLKRPPRADRAPANGRRISHRENVKEWLHFPTEPSFPNHTLMAVGVLADQRRLSLSREQRKALFGGQDAELQRDAFSHLHGAVFHLVPELGGEHTLAEELKQVIEQGELVNVSHLLPNTRLRRAIFGVWIVGEVVGG